MSMLKKPTVVIGIPACNEEANVASLLRELLQQQVSSAVLKKIIVYSDGSTDATVSQAKRVRSAKLVVRVGKKRRGKTERINQIFASAKSDIVIILDADITLANDTVIESLLKPMVKDPTMMLVSGQAKPLPTHKFVSQIFLAGTVVWDFVKKQTPRTSIYYCEGRIRAFRKPLYESLRFPKASADEAFSYLYTVYNKHKFFYQSHALVYYQLPQSIPDYLRQMSRFLESQAIQETQFPKDFVDKQYCVTLRMKLLSLGVTFLTDPFFTTCYCCLIMYPHIWRLWANIDTDGAWQVSQTTKVLHP